jgi:hypothetical protein
MFFMGEQRGQNEDSMDDDAREEQVKRQEDALQSWLKEWFCGALPFEPDPAIPLTLTLQWHADRERFLFEEPLLHQLDHWLHRTHARMVDARRGRVFCFFHQSFDHPNCLPKTPLEVFAGYDSVGNPKWSQLVQMALSCRLERVTDLYETPPKRIAFVVPGHVLHEAQLDVFGPAWASYRIVAQVVLGYLTHHEPFALTVQWLETRIHQGGVAHELNLITHDPHGFQEWLQDKEQREFNESLKQLQRQLSALRGRAAQTSYVAGVERHMNQFAKRLEQWERKEGRRTRHAEFRRMAHGRPVSPAIRDAQAVTLDRLYRDELNASWVVRGGKQRCHFFSDVGKHITSFSLARDALERRLRQGKWRPVQPEQWLAFRDLVYREDAGLE